MNRRKFMRMMSGLPLIGAMIPCSGDRIPEDYKSIKMEPVGPYTGGDLSGTYPNPEWVAYEGEWHWQTLEVYPRTVNAVWEPHEFPRGMGKTKSDYEESELHFKRSASEEGSLLAQESSEGDVSGQTG
jgi:hypothetical protein